MVNYYELLGLNQGATEDEIRDKLKDKKRLWTQRQNAPKPTQQQEASNNLRMVPDIEANLFDSEKRSAYDKQLRTAPKEKSSVDTNKIDVNDLIQEGYRFLSVGNIPDALSVATKATDVQGDNPDAWALLGYAHAKWGEIDKAVYEYNKAIDKRPNDASFYFDLGGIYEGVEKWQDAMTQYERAVKIDPDTTVYRAAMGGVFIENEMYSEGIEILEQCSKEEPDNEGYKYLLALAFSESGYQGWTFVSEGGAVPPGYYATSLDQIEMAEQLIDKAEKIGTNDSDLNIRIEKIREDIVSMRKKNFNGSWLVAIIGTPMFGLGILYYFSSLIPQYRLNERIIEGKGVSGVHNFLNDMMDGEGSLGGLAFGVFITLMFLPIIICWNFYKNYAK